MKYISLNTRLIAHTILFMLLIPGWVFNFSSERQLNIWQESSLFSTETIVLHTLTFFVIHFLLHRAFPNNY